MEEKIVEIISKEDYKKYFNKNIINEVEWNNYINRMCVTICAPVEAPVETNN